MAGRALAQGFNRLAKPRLTLANSRRTPARSFFSSTAIRALGKLKVRITKSSRYTLSMPKADRVKEEIGWLKIVFAVAVALDASLIAWLAQNYETASPVMAGAGLVAALALAVIIVLVNRRAYRRLDELENL